MPDIEIGKILNTHGLKGDLKVEPWCDGIDVYKYLKRIFINNSEFFIENVKSVKNVFLLKLKGIEKIEDAEKYKGCTIMANQEELPPLPEGVFYIKDLIGLDVYDSENNIGKIYDWIETGKNNVYVVKGKNGKDILIPYIESVVKNVDLKNNKMIVKLIEGMT
ncbi:MAG: 16S rRNA processing protein RimM [Clostridia bacterium]|nr:16S rRNA processing protein RimM [Clostridia bacterium]